MINVSFLFNGTFNGYPSWIGFDGATQLNIVWNGLYWEMLGWPYDGEPRNYTNTLNPTTGWTLFNNTTLTATFNITLGACPLPTPSVTPTKTITPTPSVTPGSSLSPTPTPTSSGLCNTPSLFEVTFIQRKNNNYIFNLFFTSDSNCSGMIYEYSCDNITWQTCIYNSCVNSFGCQSPVQISVEPLSGCTICGTSWYFRIKQCCSNGLQSNYSNVIQVLPPSPSPSKTPSITRTPSVTPSKTPTPSPSAPCTLLTTITINFWYDFSPNTSITPYTNFTNSLASACNAFTLIDQAYTIPTNEPGGHGQSFKLRAYAVGEKLYPFVGQPTTCSPSPSVTGYYITNPDPFYNSFFTRTPINLRQVTHVVNGIIQSITLCN